MKNLSAASNPLESDIQVSLVEYLNLMAPIWGFLFFAVSNEAMGRARSGGGLARMAKLRKMGLRSGVADIVIVKDGRAYFLELKRRGGKQSDNQKEFEADSVRCGAKYALAFSFDDAVSVLKSWRIIA